MRFLLAITALAFAHPVYANDACLAAPTRDCLFEHAREAAFTSGRNLNDVGHALIIVAAREEQSGAGDWDETINRLRAEFQDRYPEYTSEAVYESLGDDVFRKVGDLALAPKTALTLAQMLERKGDHALTFDYVDTPGTETSSEIYVLGTIGAYAMAGETDDVERLIDAAKPDARAEFTRFATRLLINKGDKAKAEVIDPDVAQAQFVQSVIDDAWRLPWYGDFDDVNERVSQLPEGEDRTLALWLLANGHAQAGSPEAAKIIAGLQPVQGEFGQVLAAEVYARIDDVVAASALLKTLETSSDKHIKAGMSFVRFVLMLRAHQFDDAVALLDEVGSGREMWYEPLIYLESVGDVLVALDPAARAEFIAQLPEGLDPFPRIAIAHVQIKRGELDAVTLPGDPYFYEESVSGKPNLASELALARMAAGDTVGALEAAKVANQAALYADLALMLD